MILSSDSQREGQVATGSDAKDRRGGDESFCKSSKTQNRSLMEKLFHNLKELSADTSQETPKAHLSHKNKENVSFANGSRHLLSSNAGTNVDLKASERSFGQSIDLNGIQGMNTENREHFKDSLRVGSVQLPPRPTLTGREKISKGGNDRETISAREAFQKVESSYAMGISPAKKQTRSLITKVDFIDLQKPSSEFYSSNKESSLAQFTKYEEALQSELNNATTQNDFQSELDNGLYHSSQSQDQIKKLTIFGEPLPESSCDEDEDEQENLSGNKIKNDYFGHDQNEVDQPLGFNRTIKELSEAREDSGIYISSEDKRSLLRRLKENFEQNNAFDCVEFVVDTTNRKDNHDDSLDIDNRRVLFESEVRKQIHRNIPFEETEEYAKLELIHKLSKNKKSQDESKCSNRPSIHDQSMGRRRDDTLDLQVDDESDDQCQILNTSFSEQRFTASNKVSCRKPSNNGMISKNQSQDVSRSNNKSITLRSIGEKQLEELRNMFFDSSDPQEESKMEEVKEKATLLGKSRQKKSSKNIELSRISGMNLTSAVQKTGENPSASNASRSSGIQNSLQKKSAIIEEKQTREVKIPQRPMLAEASYSSSATLALQELTEYYLDQSREKSEMSRRMSKAENSMRIGLTPIGRDGGGSYQQNSTFFSGEEGNPFPSVTSMDGDQMLDNLTEVLKTDVKSKKQSQVVLIRAEQVEQMRRVIDMLESENKDLRQKFAKTPSGVPPRDRAKKPIKGKENSPVENVPAYEYSNEIRNFKDLADMAPRHSYSQIHMRRHLARHS